MSNSYSTSAYFWGRSFATFPFDIAFPFLFISICYFACHLNNEAGIFFYAVLILELVYWHASSYGLFISTLFKDVTTALTLVPVLLIPLMLLGGFFINLNDTPKVFWAIAYISPFKYGFQGLITN
jgi:ABC-type multidrug transport system permease subunit